MSSDSKPGKCRNVQRESAHSTGRIQALKCMDSFFLLPKLSAALLQLSRCDVRQGRQNFIHICFLDLSGCGLYATIMIGNSQARDWPSQKWRSEASEVGAVSSSSKCMSNVGYLWLRIPYQE